MKKKKGFFKRIGAALLAATLIAGSIPGTTLDSHAQELYGEVERAADPSTMDAWEDLFGPSVTNTEHAGGVWMDKSVLTSDYGSATLDNDNNFLVAMSALASNKSIVGYEYLPTDTMLILDVSGSMEGNKATQMIAAANNAIATLQGTNNHNRVGVVLYSGNSQVAYSSTDTATVILPLGRYDDHNESGNTYLSIGTFVQGQNRGQRVSVNDDVTTEAGESLSDDIMNINTRVVGGTYIQNGIYKAMQQFESADTTIEDGIQQGTTRIPIFVLMSDGAPTTATNTYSDVGTSRIGQGSESHATPEVGFVTQLTAAYARAVVDVHYEATEPRFYTLGLGLDSVTNSHIARSVMDPENSDEDIDDYWETLIDDGSVTLNGRYSVTTDEDYLYEEAQQLYVDEYYAASDADDLNDAFQAIVDEIILQSRYTPTLAGDDHDFDGYITLLDDIGEYMEVKDVKGLMIGDTLFSGSSLAKNFVVGGNGGDLGTTENPTALGDNFVWAVMQRLGLDKVAARNLIRHAYEYKQLYYNSEDDYDNRISWYADSAGDYLGFYDENFTEAQPGNATYIVDSYGYIDTTTVNENDKANMLYCSVQVRTEIATGAVSVLWRIPASLIPLVSYDITIEGDNLENPGDISVEHTGAEPIRLLYEVGLREDINAINVAEKVDSEYAYKNADGTYTFYTNAWDESKVGVSEASPSKDINTVGWFEPSTQNERYYYTEDAAVYVSNGNGGYELYTGGEPSGSGYYHVLNVFDWSNGASNATVEKIYEPISETVIDKAKADTEGNGWYIPKGEIYRYMDEYNELKTVHSDSDDGCIGIHYSNYATVEHAEGEHYYADAILGNNGMLTLTPAQGIKVTKTMEVVAGDVTEAFTFEISGPEDGSYTVVYVDAEGNEIVNAEGEKVVSTVTFNNGKATIELVPGESMYILGLPEGTYTVVEEALTVDETTYEVSSIKIDGIDVDKTESDWENASVDVAKQAVTTVEFTNTVVTTGNLVVQKIVEHPFGDNYVIPDDITFDFDVILEYPEDATGKKDSYTTSKDGVVVTPDAEGKFTIEGLKAGEAIVIHDLPVGTQVTVTENLDEDETPGFSVKDGIDNPQTTQIPGTGYALVSFTNTYTPTKVSPVNLDVTGTKLLEGRDWKDGDSFTFVLERREYGVAGTTGYNWTVVDEATVTYDASDADFNDFVFDKVKDETYTSAGTYAYRMREVASGMGGITYDAVVSYFDVVVADANMDGKLEIDRVTTYGNATYLYDNNQKVHHVDVTFNNKYAPEGSASIQIKMQKKFTEGSLNTTLEGYSFGLYVEEGDELVLVKESDKTSAAGEAWITMVYDAHDKGMTYNYVLKEMNAGQTIDGVTYDDTAYPVQVKIVDNLDGTISAYIADADEDLSVVSETESESETMIESETEESQTEADTVEQTEADTAEQTEADTAEQTEADTAEQTEADTDSQNLDDSENVIATMEANETQTLEEGTASSTYVVTFTNTYDPADTEVEIAGNKELTGRDMKAVEEGEFTFELYEATETFEIKGEAIQTVKNKGDKTFAFEALTFARPDTYNYIVKEENAGETIDSITYDKTFYQVQIVVAVDVDDPSVLVHDVTIKRNGAEEVEDISFTNTYKATSGKATLSGTKIYEGENAVLQADQFTFELYEATEDFEAKGDAIQTVKNKGDKTFTFDELTFDKADTYYYVVMEENAGKKVDNVTYDDTVYNVKIEVSDEGNGAMDTVVTIMDGEEEVEAMSFTNTFLPPPPETPEQTESETPEQTESETPEQTESETPEQTESETPEQTESEKETKPSEGVSTGDKVPVVALVTVMVVSVQMMIFAFVMMRKKR